MQDFKDFFPKDLVPETAEMTDVLSETNSTLRASAAVMRLAKEELDDRLKQITRLTHDIHVKDGMIRQHREERARHERIINKLMGLLNAEDLDAMRDLLRDEYEAIHGPIG